MKYNMIERRIRIITPLFLFVPLYWLIGKIRNEKKGTSQKFILLLNWQELNEEKQKIVKTNTKVTVFIVKSLLKVSKFDIIVWIFDREPTSLSNARNPTIVYQVKMEYV